MNKVLEFSTTKSRELVNITSDVASVVRESNIKEGACLVFVPHATAAILINEDEAGFKADIESLLDLWIPKRSWEHDKIDNNATAHLASSLIGQSKTLPIKNADLQRGTWQEIFLVELDGPRSSRHVIIQVSN